MISLQVEDQLSKRGPDVFAHGERYTKFSQSDHQLRLSSESSAALNR